MSNPFDDPDGTYLVLANDEGQWSLWPAGSDVPAGWRVVRPPGDREAALAFVAGATAPRAAGGARSHLVERERQLDELRAALADGARGAGQVVLVDGGVASGKTALVTAVARQAADAGALVLTATGSRAESTFRLGVVGQLWHSARAQVADLADDWAPSTAPETRDGEVLLERVCQALLDLAVDRPLVLVADDIQFADFLSLQAFLYLQRRIRTARVVLVLSGCVDAQPDGSAFRAELTRQPHCRHVVLRPLSPDGVRRVLAERFETEVAARLAGPVHALTGGTPVLVHAAARDRLADPTDGDEPVVGSAYVEAALSCLHRSDDRLLGVARGLAVLGAGAGPHLVAALTERTPGAVRQACGALDLAGLTAEGSFRHSAVCAAVLADLPQDEHVRLRRRAARLLHEDAAAATDVAAQLLAAREPVEPWAVGVLRTAATEALAAGRHPAAADCLDLALGSTDDPADRAAVAAALVRALWGGKPAGVPQHLTALLTAARSGHLADPEALALVGDLAWHGRTGEAEELLDRLGHLATHPDPELVADHRVARAWLAQCRPDTPETPDAQVAGQVPLDHVEHVLQRIRVGESPPYGAWQALRALVHADELTVASDWCERLREEAASRAAVGWLAVLSDVAAAIALRHGDLSAVVRHARAALTEMPPRGWGIAVGSPLAHLVLAATLTGELAEADDALRTATPPAMRESLFWLPYLHARGIHHDAVDRPHAALADLTAVGEQARRYAADHPGALPWRVDLARVHLRMGQAAQARLLVTEHLAHPGATSPRTRGTALRVLGSAYPPKERQTMLRRAVDLLHECGDRYELAHVFADLGDASLALGEPGRAKMMGRRAALLAEGCRAEPLYRRLRQLCAAPDQQDWPDQHGGPDVLSAAERRVVNLAARGHTNREIGRALFITVSTVEQHLTRAYRKLNVSGRTDLLPVGPQEACA